MANKIHILALGVVLGLSACSQGEQAKPSIATTNLTSGIALANLDKRIAAKDDFYRHVNGTWLANTPIPADKSNYGAFSALYENSQNALRNIIEKASSTEAEPGSEKQKIGDFYNAYLDQKRINELGITPIQAHLTKIGNATSLDDIARLMASLYRDGGTSPVSFWVNNDAKQSTEYAVYLTQSGLGLPDRDYYLKDEQQFVEKRQAYLTYITTLLTKLGSKNSQQQAEAILLLETKLAEKQWSRVENRDANKVYNKMTLAEIENITSGFSFSQFAQTAGLESVEHIIVRQPSYLSGFAAIFAETSVADWQAYLAFHFASDYAKLLSDDMVALRFDFYGKTLSGIEQDKPRWKKAVDAADAVLGEALGKLYVAENFKPEAKVRMQAMVENLIQAYADSIKNLDWMSEATKAKALVKLSKFTPKIGYPDKWKDYRELIIKPDDLVGNYLRHHQLEFNRMMAKLGKPIDKSEWHMTPQTVNAYYNSVNNEIVFPAAILQPPFFNLAAEDAVNYGAIGAVIGHEIGHGFDDQGAKYDGDGNLNNWWTAQDEAEFKKRGKQLIAQYNAYAPFADAHVNGELTLGENIGDLGGLTMAYRGYMLSLEGKKGPVIDGYSAEQRLFMGWSQIWRRQYREEELRRRLMTDPHAPSEYRVIGIVSQMPEFYRAFNISEQDKMYIAPEKRVKIW